MALVHCCPGHIMPKMRKQGSPLTGREDGGKAQTEWRRSAVMTPALVQTVQMWGNCTIVYKSVKMTVIRHQFTIKRNFNYVHLKIFPCILMWVKHSKADESE